MKRLRSFLAVCAAAAMAALPANAQNESGEQGELGAEKRQAIQEMLRVSQARQIASQVFEAIQGQFLPQIEKANPKSGERIRRILREEIDAAVNETMDEIMAASATVWAKHFTTEEVRRLTDFYKTELGRKLVEKQPKIFRETLQATMPISREMMDQVRKALRRRLREENLTVPDVL